MCLSTLQQEFGFNYYKKLIVVVNLRYCLMITVIKYQNRKLSVRSTKQNTPGELSK